MDGNILGILEQSTIGDLGVEEGLMSTLNHDPSPCCGADLRVVNITTGNITTGDLQVERLRDKTK